LVWVLEDRKYRDFREGSYQYLIADDVNIRSAPSTSSSIVATLPIATRLEIIRKMDNRYVYNNISFPWYKVSFIINNRYKTGYVVGGFIAEEFSISTEEYRSIIFLSGLSKYYPHKGITYQIRVAEANNEIDKIEFLPSSDGYNFYFNVIRDEDISNGIYISKLHFTISACGEQSNEVVVFFDKNKLYHIKTFSNTEKRYLSFKDGKIQLYRWYFVPSNNEEFDDVEKEIIEEYIWDGSRCRLQRIY